MGGGRIVLGKACHEPHLPGVADVGHEAFSALLGRFVDERGFVNYTAWKQASDACRDLHAYLDSLGRIDRRKPASLAHRLAFWINAYNAVIIAGILARDPVRCDCRPGFFRFRPWRQIELQIGEERFSPHEIEHRILRPLGEPRIHFALVCGSRSCPPLRPAAYDSANLNSTLNANARSFFRRPDSLQYDAESRTFFLSKLIKWYRSDFAKTRRELPGILATYFPIPFQEIVHSQKPQSIRYLPFDWSLNHTNEPDAIPEPTQ